MNRGYVKTWRKSLDSGMLRNPVLWTFWSWCLLKASHKPCKIMVGYQEVALDAGQFVFGRHRAAKELAMTERSIRTCLQTLVNMQNVTIKTTNKYSIITVVNWHIYQECENENDQQNDQQVTNKRPANDQQVTTNKNVKNVENNIIVENTNVFSPLARSRKHSASGPQVSHDEYMTWAESECRTFISANGLHEAYPAVTIETECAKAMAWLRANPQNRKKSIPRFLNNWLSRAQDNARPAASKRTFTKGDTNW